MKRTRKAQERRDGLSIGEGGVRITARIPPEAALNLAPARALEKAG
jgi:hypothetical protein